MNCPQCHKENPNGSRFCQYCGTTLVAVSAPPIVGSTPVVPSMSSSVPHPIHATSTPSPASRQTFPVQGSVGTLGDGGTSVASIWGPFAGYGQRGRHVSWLLDELGERADALRQAVQARFEQRQIPRAAMRPMNLVGQGILVERRPFYFIQRGITTIAVYIARFGQDLYISQVTYAKGPINSLRVAILGLMLLFQLFYVFGYSAALASSAGQINFLSSNGGVGSFLFLLCVIGPVGFFNGFLLWLALLYSIYKWIRERDFFAILRTPPNEFQLDDIIALEKSVEETVRQSLDVVGIDKALMPPTPTGTGSRTRLL